MNTISQGLPVWSDQMGTTQPPQVPEESRAKVKARGSLRSSPRRELDFIFARLAYQDISDWDFWTSNEAADLLQIASDGFNKQEKSYLPDLLVLRRRVSGLVRIFKRYKKCLDALWIKSGLTLSTFVSSSVILMMA